MPKTLIIASSHAIEHNTEELLNIAHKTIYQELYRLKLESDESKLNSGEIKSIVELVKALSEIQSIQNQQRKLDTVSKMSEEELINTLLELISSDPQLKKAVLERINKE